MLSVIRENVRLAPYTTLRIGGIARYFADVHTEEKLREALDFARQCELSVFVLGGGSNVLISDLGFSGLVLHMAFKGITFHPPQQGLVKITAASGEEWDQLVQQCIERKLAGVECLSGIPGFVGGTPIQNVGAYGQEVSQTIIAVRAFDRQQNAVVELSNEECLFSYRASIFNTTERDRYVVISVTYELKEQGEPSLQYADLQHYFAQQSQTPSLAEVREAVLAIRASKGMLITPNDPDSQSVGSFFKNPIISKEQFKQLGRTAKKKELIQAGEVIPYFVLADEQVKVPAAWLIEKAGFQKGFARGRVGISSKHTLAIINRSNATATEMLTLVERIQKQVKDFFGIALVPEPVMIGFEYRAAL